MLVKAQYQVEEVSAGVYSFSADVSGNEYVSMFIATGEGVIVIEPVSSAHSSLLVEVVANITQEPVSFMLHSHNHWDHGNGGAIWRAAGAEIWAHELAAQWMAANTNPDMVEPDQTWSGDFFSLSLGNVTLEFHYVGLNHGLGNTIFLIPDLKIAYMADIVTPKRVQFAIVPDFNLREWERSLQEILALDFDRAVYSHNYGENRLVGRKQDVEEELQFMRDLREATMELLMQGLSIEEVAVTLRLPQYEHWAKYDEWLSLNVYRVALDIWMGPFPWIPNQTE